MNRLHGLARSSSRVVSFAYCLAWLGCSAGDDGPAPLAQTGGASGLGGASSGGGQLPAGSGGNGAEPPIGGGGAPGGGTGGSGVDPQPVIPTQNGARYAFATGELLLEIDPSVGARVTTFALNGVNLLTGPEVHPSNWGSTFWVAPQSVWSWPPPAEIDSNPYAASVQGAKLVMTSQPSPLGVTVTKEFAVDTSGWVSITYSLLASGAAAVSFGPWEVTRVALGGFSFFPTGSDPVAAPATEGAGATWLSTSPPVVQGKYAADGSGGWLAHVQGELLMVKRFGDLPPAYIAPGQKEVELYIATAGYEELEVHGPYWALAPGDSVSWTVNWLLTRIPSGTAVTPGSPELVAFVESLVP